MRIHGTGTVKNALRQHGLGKGVAGVDRQFALGVIQTADGLPIAHDVFEGNVDVTRSLTPMIERLLKRFALKRVVLVVDRGLLIVDIINTLGALAAEQAACRKGRTWTPLDRS